VAPPCTAQPPVKSWAIRLVKAARRNRPAIERPTGSTTHPLRGHVDRVDKFLIAGWALCEEEPAERPEIQFVQDGEVVVSLRPCFPAPQLRAALNLPASPAEPVYHWRLWMPLANGLRPDVPFSVVFRETGAVLVLGESRRLAAMQSIDPAARVDLDEAILFTPTVAGLDDALDVFVVVEKPSAGGDVTVKLFDRSETRIAQVAGSPSVLGKQTQYGSVRIARSQLMAAPGAHLRLGVDVSDAGDARSQFQSSLRSLWIPKAVFDASLLSAPLPDVANIHRVSGPMSDALQYLVFGATTFHQLDLIARRYAGRPIAELGTVLDWGVGCGRVLRQILESGQGRAGRTIGLDIDEVNVGWCAENLAAHGDFGVLSLDGFELEERSVDFLYGISVMTHLTEHHQLMWLDQIRRILKPGGLAVLSINGEGQYYREPQTLFAPFVERFGFFDSIADDAIGEDRSTYYRATYNSRSYIQQTWPRYFEIIDVIVMGHFAQDYVVLRNPTG
jgi:SAM-dependent methyltransferase